MADASSNATCITWASLGDAQHAGWIRTIDAIGGEDTAAGSVASASRQLALFPEDRAAPPALAGEAVHVRLDQIELRRPRQWGACWLALHLWETLELDRFWEPLLLASRKGTRWLSVL